EFIVAHILSELLDLIETKPDTIINVEYSVKATRLRGNVDYVLEGSTAVVVIEAKHDEIERGFRQLGAEMIGVAEQVNQSQLYGAVTTGHQWQFGLLKRDEAVIIRDLQPYSVLGQVYDLLRILVELT
ncbi:MAG: hypothetical protein AAF639_40165, partial [Chloroflexota bacterium]